MTSIFKNRIKLCFDDAESSVAVCCGKFEILHIIGEDSVLSHGYSVTFSVQQGNVIELPSLAQQNSSSLIRRWFQTKSKEEGEITSKNSIDVSKGQDSNSGATVDWGSLNETYDYAAIGNLQLTVMDNTPETSTFASIENLVFEQIALACHYKQSNNDDQIEGPQWYLVGPHNLPKDGCDVTSLEEETFHCVGRSQQTGNQFLLQCHWLDNTNSLLLKTPRDNTTLNWMSRLSDNCLLGEIMMPGSHDAGMSEGHHVVPAIPKAVIPYVKTQSGNVLAQLLNGSRYFDIRVDYDHDKLVTYHRTNKYGMNGQSLQDIFDNVQKFLALSMGTETVLFKISHIRDYKSHDPAKIKQQIDDLLQSYDSILFKIENHHPQNTNICELPLSLFRGKLVCLCDYQEHIDAATGRLRYMDTNVGEYLHGANLTVYDQYSDADRYSSMSKDQIQKWSTVGQNDDRRSFFFLLSWTMTPKGIRTVDSLAKNANNHLSDVLSEHILDKKFVKPNVVFVDYMSQDLGEIIIQYNFVY